jgi:hypothetical protein
MDGRNTIINVQTEPNTKKYSDFSTAKARKLLTQVLITELLNNSPLRSKNLGFCVMGKPEMVVSVRFIPQKFVEKR